MATGFILHKNKWSNVKRRQIFLFLHSLSFHRLALTSGGPVRQPSARVDYIPPSQGLRIRLLDSFYTINSWSITKTTDTFLFLHSLSFHRLALTSGGPVRQPYVRVDYIPKTTDLPFLTLIFPQARTYVDKGLDVLEDIVDVVDGEAERLCDLEVCVVVLSAGHALHHLVRVEDGRLAHVLKTFKETVAVDFRSGTPLNQECKK